MSTLRHHMFLLNPGDYQLIEPLIDPVKYHLILKSVLHGRTSAQIYIDQYERPTSSFLWNKGKSWLLGTPNDSSLNGLSEVLDIYLDILKRNKSDYFRFHYDQRWASHIPRIFQRYKLEEYQRNYLHLDARGKNWDPNPPSGIRIVFIEESFLESEYGNLDRVIDEMKSETCSVDDFFKYCFGYAALDGDKIVAWCMSEYNTDVLCEIGIETIESYQRRGLATQVARALIGHALKNNIYEIGWHSWKRNIPSIKTAYKIGFKHKLDYTVLEVWL